MLPPVGDDRVKTKAGADFTYTRLARVSAADPLVRAWLTLKPFPEGINAADPGTLQKIVTTANVAGTGQITADGNSGGAASIRFDITAANTLALGQRTYQFDVKVKTASGLEFPVADGLWDNSGVITLSA